MMRFFCKSILYRSRLRYNEHTTDRSSRDSLMSEEWQPYLTNKHSMYTLHETSEWAIVPQYDFSKPSEKSWDWLTTTNRMAKLFDIISLCWKKKITDTARIIYRMMQTWESYLPEWVGKNILQRIDWTTYRSSLSWTLWTESKLQDVSSNTHDSTKRRREMGFLLCVIITKNTTNYAKPTRLIPNTIGHHTDQMRSVILLLCMRRWQPSIHHAPKSPIYPLTSNEVCTDRDRLNVAQTTDDDLLCVRSSYRW